MKFQSPKFERRMLTEPRVVAMMAFTVLVAFALGVLLHEVVFPLLTSSVLERQS